jgi:DNA-binding GntR family transcriptional regulator
MNIDDDKLGIPKYHKLKQIIRRDILKGKYKAGDLIPSENELQKTYKVSSTTVRRALTDLVHEKLLIRGQGVGTFVYKAPVERNLWKVMSFTDNMLEMGYKPSAKIIKKILIPCPDDVAVELSISSGDRVLLLQRLRFGNDIPMMFESLYIREDLCPGIFEKELTGSTFTIYQQEYGHKVMTYRQTLEFSKPDKEIRKHMGISDRNIPYFLVVATHYQETGLPIEHERIYYRGDMYTFKTDIR